ncbi:MAG: heparinase II/III family protein [Candidatus Helarchaeota archaeon]
MKLSNLFKPSKYINKISSIKETINKSQCVRGLINKDFLFIPLSYVWRLEKDSIFIEEPSDISEYKIFGTPIDLNNINWHKDYVSGFEYPLKRFDKIKISKWFDKGIDVKFPWEISRFYFAIRLAQNYIVSKDEKYYSIFKKLVLDWIEKNPFCYGVNWCCTMEVAIRAINWIVAINIFGEIFKNDIRFKEILSISLLQHSEYISTFPEIYELNHRKHTTNHTTADYAGLLFLALTFKSKEWLKQAVAELEECIRYQTYEDGVNFEASIPYHRLVLEMFAYSVVVAIANGIEFSKRYYELLFKMFEYTAAYMDNNGNAPQVGDNDSGRILIFHDSDEHDHSYLLDLGEHIFDYKFKSQCKKRNQQFTKWLPTVEKIQIEVV